VEKRLSVNEIANKLRISCQAIYQHINKNGVKPAEFITEGNNKIALYDVDKLPRYAKLLNDMFQNQEDAAQMNFIEVQNDGSAADNLTPELINSYVLLFGQDGAKNILMNNYGLRP